MALGGGLRGLGALAQRGLLLGEGHVDNGEALRARLALLPTRARRRTGAGLADAQQDCLVPLCAPRMRMEASGLHTEAQSASTAAMVCTRAASASALAWCTSSRYHLTGKLHKSYCSCCYCQLARAMIKRSLHPWCTTSR